MIKYAPEFLANVVNHPRKMSPMAMPRIGTITTELGGETTFTYGQPRTTSAIKPPNSSIELCGGVQGPETVNRFRIGCYMQISGGARWFNKYVVLQTETNDGTSGFAGQQVSDNEIVTYEYLSSPDWAFADSYTVRTVDECGNINGGQPLCLWSDYRMRR